MSDLSSMADSIEKLTPSQKAQLVEQVKQEVAIANMQDLLEVRKLQVSSTYPRRMSPEPSGLQLITRDMHSGGFRVKDLCIFERTGTGRYTDDVSSNASGRSHGCYLELTVAYPIHRKLHRSASTSAFRNQGPRCTILTR